MEQTVELSAADRLRSEQHAATGRAACAAVSRALQVMVSVIGLIVFLPVLAVLAAGIKLVSRGPVFYKGKRVGKDGTIFSIYKLRTLEVGAEGRIGARLLRSDDPFYHRLGAFLKKTKLDEIPQLFNVIKGDMNLVGPRPVRPVFMERFTQTIPGYARRLAVRPGMTGLAQLRGGYYTSAANKLRYDRIYLGNRSLRLDLIILMLTFVKLVQRWITAGSLLCALLLFVSFVPSGMIHSFSMRVLGVRFNPLLPIILAGGAYLVLHAGKSNRWFISHSAVDWPMAAFVLVSAMAVPFSVSPVTAFRGLVYLCVTGFFFTFVLVNTRPDERFARRAAQLVGLAGGGVALVGLAETAAALLGATEVTSAVRPESTMGSPLALTAYLVVCFPLVLCECFTSRSRQAKLLWLAVGIVICAAVITAGGRLGVPALIVSTGVLLVKTGKVTWRQAAAAGAACLVLLCVFGGERHSVGGVMARATKDAKAALTSIEQSSFQQLLIGYGAKTIGYPSISSGAGSFAWRKGLPDSTYLTLLLENGIAGFCLMTWLAALVVREISAAARRQSSDLRMRLWSLAAAMCGLGVAAISFNVFYNLATQLLFWGTVGIALGLCVRYGRRDHGAVLVMRFGH